MDGSPSTSQRLGGLSAARLPLSEMVAAQVAEMITTRGLEPGERLGTKASLQKQTGVAAATLNEALRALQRQGLVELKTGPTGGVFAASPPPSVRLRHIVMDVDATVGGERITECLKVRAELEALVADEAACNAVRADRAALEEILRAMGEQRDDVAQYTRLNWKLHRAIGAISPNLVLRGVYHTLLDVIAAGLDQVRESTRFAVTVDEDYEAHAELVAAILSGDRARTLQATIAHHRVSGFEPTLLALQP